MILEFIKKNKASIIGVLLVWAFSFFINFFPINQIRQQNNELKKEIKQRKKENEALDKLLRKDSILLLEKAELIKKYEKEEQKYKDLKPVIQIKYEKEKTAYIGRSLNDRRNVFAKLANE